MVIKVNIPLMFPFTCSRAKYDFFFSSLPAEADLYLANTAYRFHSFNQLLEKVGIAMCAHIQKPVDIQVFDDV